MTINRASLSKSANSADSMATSMQIRARIEYNRRARRDRLIRIVAGAIIVAVLVLVVARAVL